MNSKIIIALILLVLFIVTYGLRLARYYSNSQDLFDVSSQFPRDYYVGSSSNPEVMYVALGDSITQGTGVDKLEETVPCQVAQAIAGQEKYVHVVNLSRSGARAKYLLHEQLPQLAKLQPDYIAITIGTNDATHFTDIDEFSAMMAKIIDTVTQMPEATVLLANAADPGSFPSLPPVYAQLASNRANVQNQIVRMKLTRRDTNVKLIDLYGKGKLEISKNPMYYASDFFHPATAGYAHWASLFIGALQ